jgi:hypothetical protein
VQWRARGTVSLTFERSASLVTQQVACSSFPRRHSRRYLMDNVYSGEYHIPEVLFTCCSRSAFKSPERPGTYLATADGELPPEIDPNTVTLDVHLSRELQKVRDHCPLHAVGVCLRPLVPHSLFLNKPVAEARRLLAPPGALNWSRGRVTAVSPPALHQPPAVAAVASLTCASSEPRSHHVARLSLNGCVPA